MSAVVRTTQVQKKLLKLKRIQRIATKMVPKLEDLTYEERLKEMHLSTQENGERDEETNRKDLILRRKGEARNLRGHKKNSRKKFA